MNFELTMEDFTIIQNALHYYKKVNKRGEFSNYDEDRINRLRDKLAYQMIPSFNSKDGRPHENINDPVYNYLHNDTFSRYNVLHCLYNAYGF